MNAGKLLVLLWFTGATALAQIMDTLTAPIQDMTPPSGVTNVPSAPGTQNPPAPSPVQEIWNGLGSALNTACEFFGGTPLNLNLNGIPVSIPIVARWTPELAWICEAYKTWGFINSVVNQDWAQVLAEIGGQWIGDLVTSFATAIGIEIGSAAWANEIADFNDKLRNSYSQFMSKVRNAVWDAAQSSLNRARAEKMAPASQRLPQSQSQNPTALKIEENAKKVEEALIPTKTLAAYGVLEERKRVERQAEVMNSRNRSQEALAMVTGEKGTVQSLMNKESAYFGIKDPITGQPVIDPTTGQPLNGLISETISEASQAPDTRTAVEVLTKMVGHVAAIELYGSRAITETLAALVTQMDVNNQMLAQMLLDAGRTAVQIEREVREEIRDASVAATVEVFAAQAAGEGIKKIQQLVFQPGTPTGGF